MPYPVKIQPIDFNSHEPQQIFEAVTKPPPVMFKSRFKRLIEKQFSNVLRSSSSSEKLAAAVVEDFEPSSVCLDRMVQNFIEENNDNKPQQQKCGRNRCNCFNGNGTDSSGEEPDSYSSSSSSSINACEVLKSLVPCSCVSERNLLADTAKIVEMNKINRRKDEFCRKVVVDDLVALGYNASICKSEWEKASSYPAGKYEYVDVVIGGEERFIIDIDFRSEFEIARPTKAYKLILQTLPSIFVGKPDRLGSVIGIVSEAAKQSLKKKGMPIPPWRKAEYVKAKWLSPFTRIGRQITPPVDENDNNGKRGALTTKSGSSSVNELELLFGDKENIDTGDRVFVLSKSNCNNGVPAERKWELPEIKPRSLIKGVKMVTGLASVIDDEP